MLQRLLESFLGPQDRPLEGIHQVVLESLVRQLPSDRRVSVEHQLREIRSVRLTNAGTELWLSKTADDRWLLTGLPDEVRLGIVNVVVGGNTIRATVWLLHGRLRLVEYNTDVRPIVHAVPTSVNVELSEWSPGPRGRGSRTPISREELRGWVRELVEQYNVEELFRPLPDLKVHISKIGTVLPSELQVFWSNTDGLCWKKLSIAGVSETEEFDLDGEIWISVGILEGDPIAIRKASREGELWYLPHDTPRRFLGTSFEGALRTLFTEA